MIGFTQLYLNNKITISQQIAFISGHSLEQHSTHNNLQNVVRLCSC